MIKPFKSQNSTPRDSNVPEILKPLGGKKTGFSVFFGGKIDILGKMKYIQ